jgi:hypothetical protein
LNGSSFVMRIYAAAGGGGGSVGVSRIRSVWIHALCFRSMKARSERGGSYPFVCQGTTKPQ